MLSEILGLSLRQSSEPDLSHFKGIDPSYSPLQIFSGNRHCLATTEVQNCPFTYMYFLYQQYIRYSSTYPYGKVPNRTWLILKVLTKAITNFNIFWDPGPSGHHRGSRVPLNVNFRINHIFGTFRHIPTPKFQTGPILF